MGNIKMMKKRIYLLIITVVLILAVIAVLVIEKKIDKNVFRGTQEDLQKLLVSYKEAEGEMIYPIKKFWLDEEKEALYLLEEKETIQVRKIDLSPDQLLEESVLLDRDGFETLLADTYGLLKQTQQETFSGLQADLFCQEEDGKLFLGGRVSGILQEAGRKYEIVYEIDRESEAVSARGYLQDLAIAPLFQEFLLHNLTVPNSLEQDTKLGKDLGFFDDEIYLSGSGTFHKRFAVLENSKDGRQELFFRMMQTNGEEDLIYILAQEKGRLVCRDVLSTTFFEASENQKKAREYHLHEAGWLDCASFFEIPTKYCGEYLSREEVFEIVAEGDLSVVDRKPFDPEWMMRNLETACDEGDSRRLVGCDIDGDGFKELLLLLKYDFEEYERIGFILDYRNGRAVCVYLDCFDVTEWLILGEAGRLVHCSYRNNGRCFYYGFYECTLSAGGIKELDDTGNATEVCCVERIDETGMGLWWWEGQQPEITQPGTYFTRIYQDHEAEGGRGERKKELVSEEEFLEAYTELTGEERVWSEVLTVINLEDMRSSGSG